MMYSEKLKDPRWQKKRLEILNRDNFSCTLCFDEKTTLHVHHEKYNGNPWEADSKYLKTLCADCHELVESLKKNKRWELDYLTGVVKSKTWHKTYFTILTDDSFTIFNYSENGNILENSANHIEVSDLFLILEYLKRKGING